MKKLFAIWLLLGVSFVKTTAQNKLPPAYEIKTDTTAAAIIKLDDAYWQMLEDKEGKLTIDQVSNSSLANKFHYNTTKTNEIDHSIRTYWFRYRFQNDRTHEVKIAIPTNATHADFYTPDSNGKWDHQLTGVGVPWSKLKGLKRITAVIYTIPAGSTLMVYERYHFRFAYGEPRILEINFGFADRVIREYYDDSDSNILYSFLLGFLLLAALFNLYFFLIIRERVYLFFSLALFGKSLDIVIFQIGGVFLPEHPTLNRYLLQTVAIYLQFFFRIHFVRYFLETFKHEPRWDRFLVSLSILAILYFSLLPMEIIPYGYIYLGIGVVNFFILITFILSLRSGNKSTRWTIAAILPAVLILTTPLIYYLFSALEKYTGIPIPGFVVWSDNWINLLAEICLIWLLIFFSWSLFQRYHQLQKQIAEEKFAKERLAKEKDIERSQLMAQRVELEMQALRSQMNPHFIFNSLNSIDLFILQNDKAKASKYLTKFSRLIRMILNSSASTTVSLAEDLEALQLYLELERLRCEQKFNFEIKYDPDIDADFIQVPPMLLQPFAENAIWHGLMNKKEEGHLCINIDQEDSTLICTITDDGIGRKKAAELEDKSGKHRSMGMKITESRIAMMQKINGENKSVEIRDLVDSEGNAAGTEVVLRIPVVQI
jgi:sensor histidine kinase YesM